MIYLNENDEIELILTLTLLLIKLYSLIESSTVLSFNQSNKTLMINSVSPKTLDSNFTSLSASMIIPEIDSFNLYHHKKPLHSAGKSNTKPKPSTDRAHNQN